MMKLTRNLLLVGLVTFLVACGGAEERKAVYLEKAEKSLNAGDLDKARIELKNVLQIDPKDARAYFKLGTIFERQQEFRKAFGNYNKAAELDPGNSEYEAKLGRFYLILAGDVDKATEKMDLILAKDANDMNGLLLKAGIQIKQGKADEAKTIAKSLFQAHPDDAEVALFLSTLYLKDKQTDAAIQVLNKANDANPDNQNLQSTLANVLFVNKDYAKSEKILKQILETHPDVFKNHLSLALFYQKTDQAAKAEAVLRAAIVADEEDVQRKAVLIEFIQQTQNDELAIKELEGMINNNPNESSLRLGLARLQIGGNNIDAATATYKSIVKDFSDEEAGITSRVNLAKIYMQKKDVLAATTIINEAADIAPNDSEVNLVKAKIALFNKDIEQAIISLRTVVKNSPEKIEAYILLAGSHKANGDENQAQDVMTRAYENNRDNIKALLPLAKYHAQNKNIDDAEKAIDSYLGLDANSYDALSIKSSILNGRKDYAEAYELAEKTINLHPDKANGYIQSIPLLLTNKKVDEAISLLSTGYEKSSDIQVLKLKAELEIAAGKPDDAIASLKSIDEKNIDEPVQLLLAKAYASKNDVPATKQALLESIKQDKTRTQSYLSLASIYFNEKNTQQAISVLKDGASANPDATRLAITLAGYYEKSGDIDKAIAVYESILTKQTDNLLATNNLAALLSEHKQDPASINRAVELADKLKNTEQPVIRDTVGWVYYKSGKYSDAVEVLEQVVTAMPEIQIFNYHLGMAYYKNGDKEKAKTHLEKSISGEAEFQGIEDAKQILKSL